MIMRVFSKPLLYHFHHWQSWDLFEFLAALVSRIMGKGINIVC